MFPASYTSGVVTGCGGGTVAEASSSEDDEEVKDDEEDGRQVLGAGARSASGSS